MNRYYRISYLICFCLFISIASIAKAQLSDLLGTGGGNNPLGGLLKGGNNPLDGMLKGDKNPLSGMLKGKMGDDHSHGDGGHSHVSGEGLFSVMQDMIESSENTNLGPVGRYVLGRNLAARVVGANKIVENDDPRVGYVRRIAITLLQASRYGSNYVDPVVIILDESKQLNAFAAPGGFIFITTGMLNFLKNEDELAFVIAHEISHIELDHGLSAIKQNEGSKLFTKGTEAIGGSEIGGMFGGFMEFAENGYSQAIEGEADERGSTLASSLGYDYKAGIAVIQRLEQLGGKKHIGYPEDRVEYVKRGASGFAISDENVRLRADRFNNILR